MNNEEREIDLLALFMALLHRWWIIVLAGAICGAAGLCFAKFAIDPTYESTTSVYVVSKQGEGNLTYSDLQLGTQLTKDYGGSAEGVPVGYHSFGYPYHVHHGNSYGSGESAADCG